jgi:hypothetical protein
MPFVLDLDDGLRSGSVEFNQFILLSDADTIQSGQNITNIFSSLLKACG